MMLKSTRLVGSVAAMLIATATLVGCGAGGSNSSCGPDGVSFSNSYGTISMQQKKKGAGVQWGAYPTKNLAGTYTAVVKINGKQYDKKTQTYAPHGSILAGRVKTGDIVRVDGGYEGASGSQSFWLECKSL